MADPVRRSARPRLSSGYSFPTLPDYLAPGLDVVFVGINPGAYSLARGHYFARRSSRFWPAFSRSRLSLPVRRALALDVLGPEHDAALLGFGIGFTDVVKRPTANAAALAPDELARAAPTLLARLRKHAPRVACFHGLTAYRPFLRFALGRADLVARLGPQPVTAHGIDLFVVPNPSPANAHFTVAEQTVWYDALADFLAPKLRDAGGAVLP